MTEALDGTLHALCRAKKFVHALLEALNSIRVGAHDPMKELIMDEETGLAAKDSAKQYHDQHGIEVVPRAKEQQVAYTDRRGAFLREAVHRVVMQCESEGLDVKFKYILSDYVFSGNALLSVNRSTPYNADYGRVPQQLPDMNKPIDNAAPGTMRHERSEYRQWSLAQPKHVRKDTSQRIHDRQVKASSTK